MYSRFKALSLGRSGLLGGLGIVAEPGIAQG